LLLWMRERLGCSFISEKQTGKLRGSLRKLEEVSKRQEAPGMIAGVAAF
jgi:hypothetical protein